MLRFGACVLVMALLIQTAHFLAAYFFFLPPPAASARLNLSIPAPSPSPADFAARHWRRYQCMFAYPLLIVMGLVCNACALVTICRRSMTRRNSTYLCLAVLSVADSGVLLLSAARYWIKFTFAVDVQTVGGAALCKLLLWLEYVAADFAVWLIVLVNVHRCLIIRWPFRAQELCSHMRTRIAMVLCAAACLLKNAVILWRAQVHPMPSGRLCALIYNSRFWTVFSWLDLLFRVGIPFPTILVLNVFMYRRVVRAPRVPDVSQLPTSGEHREPPLLLLHVASGRRENRRLFPLLVAINMAFLVCYAPYGVFMASDGIFHFFVASAKKPEPGRYFLFALIFQTTLTLVYVNHCINFLLYLLYGRHFRHELSCLMHPHEERKRREEGGRCAPVGGQSPSSCDSWSRLCVAGTHRTVPSGSSSLQREKQETTM